MKLDYLKIDRTLVRKIGTGMIDEALVRSILGIKAGFVEDAETLAKPGEMGGIACRGISSGNRSRWRVWDESVQDIAQGKAC